MLSQRRLPTNCQKGEKILCAIILKAASHHIPSSRYRLNTEPVTAEILEKMRARDDLRSRYLARSSALAYQLCMLNREGDNFVP